MPNALTPQQRERLLRDIRRLTRLLDTHFRVPGTNFRFGADPLLGLMPVAGDTLSLILSIYIIAQARRLGVSRWTLTQMIGNIALDATVGSIPVLGNIFDFVYRANLRNLRLLDLPPEVIAAAAQPVSKQPH